MTTTVEALKEIYVSLGGELTDTYDDIAGGVAVGDYVTIPDVSNAIAQRAASAGIELPSVTSSDNGKLLTVVNGKWNKANAPKELPAVTSTDNGDILTVVNGAWAKADAPSSGGLFNIHVNYTMPPTTPTGISATYDEIKTAITNGLVPIVFDTYSGTVYHLFTAITSGGSRRYIFARITVGASSIKKETHEITYDGTYTHDEVTYTPPTA